MSGAQFSTENMDAETAQLVNRLFGTGALPDRPTGTPIGTPMPLQQPAYQQQLPRGMLPYGTGSAGVYGPMAVAEPYLNALNQRFGWNPAGIAYSRPMQQISNFYTPPWSMPNVTTPKITG